MGAQGDRNVLPFPHVSQDRAVQSWCCCCASLRPQGPRHLSSHCSPVPRVWPSIYGLRWRPGPQPPHQNSGQQERGGMKKKTAQWHAPAVFWRRCLAAAMRPFCSHLISQNRGAWPRLTAREAGKCSLSMYPAKNLGFYYYGRKDIEYWGTTCSVCHSQLETDYWDVSSMCCSQMLGLEPVPTHSKVFTGLCWNVNKFEQCGDCLIVFF